MEGIFENSPDGTLVYGLLARLLSEQEGVAVRVQVLPQETENTAVLPALGT